MRAKIYETSSKNEEAFFAAYSKKIKTPTPNIILSIEKSESIIVKIIDFFKKFNENIIRIGFMLGGGAIAMLLILPFFSIFTSQTSIASEPSIIRNIEGSVAIKRDGIIFFPQENDEIFNSDIIVTNAKSSLEIIFFEGTVLRMDEKTHIAIEKITPHPFLFSSGGMTVHLETGKVWVKTFQKSSEEKGLILTTPNTIIYPEKSSFAAIYVEGRESILMFKNKGIVTLNGLIVEDNIEMREGEMIQFTPFDTFIPLNEKIPDEWNIGWIAQNKDKDKKYTTEYLERISTKMKEEYVLEELSNQVKYFLESNPNPDDVENLIRDINNVMLLSNSENIETVSSDEVDETEENQESESPSPTPQEKPSIYKQNKISSYSSSNISTSYKNNRIDNNVIETNETNETNEENRVSKEKYNQENIKYEEENRVSKEKYNQENNKIIDLENLEEKNIVNANEIAKKHREEEKQKKIERAVQSFSEQVEAFQFENSRTTKAKNIIDSIPIKGENLELLQKISENSPEDVKNIVEEKLKKIEKKAKEENIKQYKENLKYSAPIKSSQKKSEKILGDTSVKNNKNKNKNDIKILETSVPSL